MSNIVLYQGDCVDILKNIENESIDIVITDIPYGISYAEWDILHHNTNSALNGHTIHQIQDTSFKKRGKPINGWSKEDKKISYEYEDWCKKWAKELFRITKEASPILIFSSRRFLHRVNCALEDNGFLIRDILIWEKNKYNAKAQHISKILNKRNIFDKKYNNYRIGNLAPAYEPIIWAMKPYQHTITDCVIKNDIGGFNDINGKVPNNIIKCPCNKYNLYHETEKPVELIKYLIQLFSINENHTILDFTMGSGTTGVACKKLNRNFVGIELDEKYFKIAKERIENT